MPSKKKKYNARFPAGRIKKIMQTDEEVGKVAQAVPVIISRALELFIESLLTKSMNITQARNAKTLTPSHMKQCILSESRFDFLKDLVKNIPDASVQEDNENNALFETIFDSKTDDSNSVEVNSSPEVVQSPPPPPANFYNEQSTSSSSRTPVIQFGPKVKQETTKFNFSVNSLLSDIKEESKLHITIASQQLPVPQLIPSSNSSNAQLTHKMEPSGNMKVEPSNNIPPLIPLSRNIYSQSTGDNLCIDEDYDN